MMKRVIRRIGMWVVLAVALLLVGGVGSVHAEAPLGTMMPLGDWLGPDGSLALPSDATATLDPTGFRLISGPQEAPRFAPVSPLADQWAIGFDVPPAGNGISAVVLALAVRGTTVYAGGNFSSAGACTSAMGCNFIAKWESGSWHNLGSGTTNSVFALALSADGTTLYAAGDFNRAGACTSAMGCNKIAKWDTTTSTWSALGSGANSYINALALSADGSTLYAGGLFSAIGTCTVGCVRVAKWDPSTAGGWSALGGGVNNVVHALAVSADGGTLYAGGQFTSAGSCTSAMGCNHIARWNAANGTWHPMGNGANGLVKALALSATGSTLYAGGQFTAVDSCTSAMGCNRIAAWDSASGRWSALGSGANGSVNALALSANGSTLYAGGQFTMVDSCTSAMGCNRVAQWDVANSGWLALGRGITGTAVHALAPGSLWAGGDFTQAGTAPSLNIARWDGVPLAVLLESFTATEEADAIRLAWQTVSELDTLGFHLRRGPDPDPAQAVTITPTLIPATGSNGGASYEWLDSPAPVGTSYYWLVAIDTQGGEAWYGPVSAAPQVPTSVTVTSLVASADGSHDVLLVLAAVGLVVLGGGVRRIRNR